MYCRMVQDVGQAADEVKSKNPVDCKAILCTILLVPRAVRMEPTVIHLIPCDSVRAHKNNLLRAGVDGLQLHLRAKEEPPLMHNMTVLVILCGFVGKGVLWIQVVEEATQRRIAGTRRRPVVFPNDDEELVSVRFDIENCPLPRYGRYRVELLDGMEVLAWKPLWLLAKE